MVTVGTTPIGLTRGGSIFTVEREIRPIEADGDKGPVMGREVIDREVPKLAVNALELFSSTDMTKYYPGLVVDTTDPAKPFVTSSLEIKTTDYNDVKWEGKTKSGKKIIITVMNAANSKTSNGNSKIKTRLFHSWFSGHYTEEAPDTAPWKKEYPTT